MRELPILMNGAMVRALLEGRKTVTRRLVKPTRGRTPVNLATHGVDAATAEYSGRHNDPTSWGFPGLDDGADLSLDAVSVLAPYRCGDRLYVRETVRILENLNHGRARAFYEADKTYATVHTLDRLKPISDGRCIPNGCHREAARIWLEVTDVRVERLQNITEEQARAEGVEFWGPIAGDWRHPDNSKLDALPGFERLWDDLAQKGARWADNPFVWVVEFRRTEVRHA